MSMEITLKTISDKLDTLKSITLIGAKEVLDIKEASLLTGYSTGYLYHLTSAGEIPHYKRNRGVFFKKSELQEWLTSDRVPTKAELDRQSEQLLSLRKNRVY